MIGRDEWYAERLPKLPRPAIPVTVVCGPPGSGKSTLVAARRDPWDTLICLDEIAARLSGIRFGAAGKEWIDPALAERNRLLAALEHATAGHAWLIVGAPTPAERKHWREQLGARIVLILTPYEECERRIRAQRRPLGGERINAAWRWWQRYSPGMADEVIK